MNALVPPPALDPAAVEAALHARLRATLPADVYAAWFGRLAVASVRDARAVLSVPTPFLVAWLRRHHEGTLREALAVVAPPIAAVTVERRLTGVVPAAPAPVAAAPPPTPIDPYFERSSPDRWWSPDAAGAESFETLVDVVARRGRVAVIQDAVAGHYGVARRDILSVCRLAHLIRPRHVAMYLALTLTPHSTVEIGRRFGGRDHTTVLHAMRRVELLAARDPAFAAELADLRRRLEARDPSDRTDVKACGAHVVAVEAIQDAVAGHYGVTRRDILSICRSGRLIRPRQAAMYLARTLTPYSMSEIGRHFGGRRRATVLEALRRVELLAGRDPAFAAEIAALRLRLVARDARGPMVIVYARDEATDSEKPQPDIAS